MPAALMIPSHVPPRETHSNRCQAGSSPAGNGIIGNGVAVSVDGTCEGVVKVGIEVVVIESHLPN